MSPRPGEQLNIPAEKKQEEEETAPTGLNHQEEIVLEVPITSNPSLEDSIAEIVRKFNQPAQDISAAHGPVEAASEDMDEELERLVKDVSDRVDEVLMEFSEKDEQLKEVLQDETTNVDVTFCVNLRAKDIVGGGGGDVSRAERRTSTFLTELEDSEDEVTEDKEEPSQMELAEVVENIVLKQTEPLEDDRQMTVAEEVKGSFQRNTESDNILNDAAVSMHDEIGQTSANQFNEASGEESENKALQSKVIINDNFEVEIIEYVDVSSSDGCNQVHVVEHQASQCEEDLVSREEQENNQVNDEVNTANYAHGHWSVPEGDQQPYDNVEEAHEQEHDHTHGTQVEEEEGKEENGEPVPILKNYANAKEFEEQIYFKDVSAAEALMPSEQLIDAKYKDKEELVALSFSGSISKEPAHIDVTKLSSLGDLSQKNDTKADDTSATESTQKSQPEEQNLTDFPEASEEKQPSQVRRLQKQPSFQMAVSNLLGCEPVPWDQLAVVVLCLFLTFITWLN